MLSFGLNSHNFTSHYQSLVHSLTQKVSHLGAHSTDRYSFIHARQCLVGTRALIHFPSPYRPLTHSLTLLLAHSLTHSFMHLLTNSFTNLRSLLQRSGSLLWTSLMRLSPPVIGRIDALCPAIGRPVATQNLHADSKTRALNIVILNLEGKQLPLWCVVRNFD